MDGWADTLCVVATAAVRVGASETSEDVDTESVELESVEAKKENITFGAERECVVVVVCQCACVPSAFVLLK